MLAFLLRIRNRLVKLKNGVSTHATEWTGQPETPVTIQTQITSVDTIQTEIDLLEHQLSEKKKAAHLLVTALDGDADVVEKKAIGFHATTPGELETYGIIARKPNEKHPKPSSTLYVDIKDDSDGIGFIVSTQVDAYADQYQFERGVATDPTDVDTIPPMKEFKTTTKTYFVDDDVEKGVRYFYRVRALNASGAGYWSNASSRVQ